MAKLVRVKGGGGIQIYCCNDYDFKDNEEEIKQTYHDDTGYQSEGKLVFFSFDAASSAEITNFIKNGA